ncbi:MAG TPA: hypothetical protein VH482_04970 [Thermomicrobiales bacterium]|jgi:hypothetical protein
MFTRYRRLTALAATVGIFALIAGAPAASADTSGQVHVTGGVVNLNPITLTLCDTEASFGTNLDANGAASNSGDGIGAIHGNPALNQGAVYQWDPACTSQPALLQVIAPLTWTGSVCATQGAGTSSLSVAAGDLRYSPYAWTSYIGPEPESNVYGYATGTSYTASFAACGSGATDWTAWNCSVGFASGCGAAGLSNHNFHFYLRVDRTTTAGDFDATTTWTVISG